MIFFIQVLLESGQKDIHFIFPCLINMLIVEIKYKSIVTVIAAMLE